ncbi:MAG: Xaa-Pro peptidase family protein [Planctomycetota bacterium]|nr:Xaa-Pro peptidase family protein [Planctomycetota bacterium]
MQSARSTQRLSASIIALLLTTCVATEGVIPAQEWQPGWQPADNTWLSAPRTIEPIITPPRATPDEFSARRAALAKALGASSDEPFAIWVPARAFDELDPFFQDDDFYYLSGSEIPDIALLMVVDAEGSLTADTLFLPDKDPNFELWNGTRLSPGPDATQQTGFVSTAPLPVTTDSWSDTIAETGVARVLTLSAPPWTAPEGVEVVSSNRRDPNSLRRKLSALRLLKSDYEIACLQAAIDITGAAIRNALTEVHPEAWEYQAQGALEGTYLRLGSERPGFASIFGSGPNSVTLHYNKNRRQMQDGELMVIDVGAKYQYYCADISRTVPVNGRFTDRQRQVYEVVLAAQTAAAEAARPGMTIKDLDGISRAVIENAGYEPKHFPHSVGHWIGLDVHDVGGRVPIEAGALFTIEPGIYIAEENLGIRIEDDYLMTSEGAVKLSVAIPSDPDALEAMLASRS